MGVTALIPDCALRTVEVRLDTKIKVCTAQGIQKTILNPTNMPTQY